MKRYVILSIVVVLMVFKSAVFADENNQIQVQLQFYKFYGNLSGKTFEDEPIWTTEKVPSRYKNTVKVFNRGEFVIDDNNLEFKDGTCLWNKQEIPISLPDKSKMPKEHLQYIDSTEIIVIEHRSGSITIEAKQPIQYFEKRPDGLFELKDIELPAGMDIAITKAIENEKQQYIDLTDLVITMRSIEKREVIDGVNLAVGKPVLGKQKFEFYFRLRPGTDYGVIIKPQEGQGGMLIRLRANSTASGTYKPAEAADPNDKQS